MNTFSNIERILIVGGTGFIGRHLIQRCLQNTPFVTCLGLNERTNMEPYMSGVEFLHADIKNKKELSYVLTGKYYDYVFNLGGYIDHTLYFNGGREIIESHYIGLMNLVDCLDKDRLKSFIQIGSSDEYGSAPAPQKEDLREISISPYSLAKTAASHFIQMLNITEGFPGVVLRFFLVYGPGQDDRRFLPKVIKACLKDEYFETTEGKQLRDYCYVDDVVEAIIKAASTPQARGQIINIASGKPVSIQKIIDMVVNITGKGKPIFGAYPYRIGENMELYADISLAKKILGWMPTVSIEEGLYKTIEYYKENIT